MSDDATNNTVEVGATGLPDIVSFEAVLKTQGEGSMFDQGAISATKGLPEPSQATRMAAAQALKERGCIIRNVGVYSISGECTRETWESLFGTRLEQRSHPLMDDAPELGQQTYLAHVPGAPFVVPDDLAPFIERAYPQLPPTLFESPIPPRVSYPHLRVPDDVGMVLRCLPAHDRGITGKGVTVCVVDTGFYLHPYHEWHGYKYHATTSPDATDARDDIVGHGTAQSANVFACARDSTVIGVKMGANLTLAVKAAVELRPDIISLSWGVDVAGLSGLPNHLRPLEAAIIDAVDSGIIVCCSAGNGQFAFPACMPQVIAVGGAWAHDEYSGKDFTLEASDYASSFDSDIYPGRHVPDVAGLVGAKPRSVYILLPVQPNSAMDIGLAAGGAYPGGDESAPDEGWAVASGTSAAAPQVAGVCALLRQARPGIEPALAKAVLMASARDVVVGSSSQGQQAGSGRDSATGSGLVDAMAALQLIWPW